MSLFKSIRIESLIVVLITLVSTTTVRAAEAPNGQPTPPAPQVSTPTATSSPNPAEAQLSIRKGPGGQESVWSTLSGASLQIGVIKRFKAGTQTFHWMNDDHFQELIQAGKLTASDLADLMAKTQVGEAQGPGFYVSLNPFDSGHYGSKCLIIRLDQETKLFELDPDAAHRGFAPSNVNEQLQALGVDGNFNRKTWIDLYSLRALSNIKEGTPDLLLQFMEQKPLPGHGFDAIIAAGVYASKGMMLTPPNDWTKAHAPAWDKILRAQPLSRAEKLFILRDLLNYNGGLGGRSAADLNYIPLTLATVGVDPAMMTVIPNMVQFLQSEVLQPITIEDKAQVEKYIQDQQNFKPSATELVQRFPKKMSLGAARLIVYQSLLNVDMMSMLGATATPLADALAKIQIVPAKATTKTSKTELTASADVEKMTCENLL